MNRRSFIAGVGAAVGAAVLDPERALWVPGARVFSLPAPIVVDRVLSYDPVRRVILEQFAARRGDGLFCGVHFEIMPASFHPAGSRRAIAAVKLARMLGTSPANVHIPPSRWVWQERPHAS